MVVVAVPEENKKELLRGIENGDTVSQLILKSDIDLIKNGLIEAGVLERWDVPLITFHGNAEMDSDTPDRRGKVFAAMDNLDGTVKVVEELEEFIINVDVRPEDSVN